MSIQVDKNSIHIKTEKLKNGFAILVFKKKYKVEYPERIWKSVPTSIKKVLVENITFASTYFLPLMLNSEKLVYDDMSQPILETIFYKNQLLDLLDCERCDNLAHLSLIKKFYNQENEFKKGEGTWPEKSEVCSFASKKNVAIIPFTFGKESLLTFALCREVGIEPILVYCQEPSQPYEGEYKLKKLKEFEKKFGVKTHFIKYEPGNFKHGKEFGLNNNTMIGWGAQTTLLALQMIPFIYHYRARYVLFGNEFANNYYEWEKGWKVYSCGGYDQNSAWTPQQSTITRLLTGGECHVNSSLEPLEEINVFYILHHKYPELGKFQFSCGGEAPLKKDSAWCHCCYKCVRMYLFALACGIDPETISFKEDLLQKPNLFPHYFGDVKKTGSNDELDFSFLILHKMGRKHLYSKEFASKKLQAMKPWQWYKRHYATLNPAKNLPEIYQKPLLKIFREEMKNFRRLLP